MENNFKQPKPKDESEYKVNINMEEVVSGNKPEKETTFTSNNQKYKKKEDIEYGKKSHLEFQKMMTENKDPLAVQSRGGLKPITIEEVELHNSKGDLWTVLNGNVYDLTMYLDYHPGGEKKLMMGAGNDYKYHSWVNYKMLIGKLQIGYLVRSPIDI